jgi:DNA-directed RNA polymerase specialized sigma24 family protein
MDSHPTRHKPAESRPALPEVDPTPHYVRDTDDGAFSPLERELQAEGGDEADTNGESLARRLARDAALLAELGKAGFAGRAFDLYHEELVKYGFAVCLKWIRSGRMHRECGQRGRPVGELPATATMQDFRDLATDAAVEGAVLFRRLALVGGQWSPAGGASLATFYIGACIHVYPGVYRRWYRLHMPWTVVDPIPDDTDHGAVNPHSDVFLLRELLQSVLHRLSEINERAHVALTMRADGYSYATIAKVLGCTERAVGGLLDRGRAKCQEILHGLGGHHD